MNNENQPQRPTSELRKFIERMEKERKPKTRAEEILEMIRHGGKEYNELFHTFEIDHNAKPDWAKSQTSVFVKSYDSNKKVPLQNSHKIFQLIIARAAVEEDLENRVILFENFISTICDFLPDEICKDIYAALDDF